MAQYNDPIAESNHFIVLNEYTLSSELQEPVAQYQSESELEDEFIDDLCNLGYENLEHLTPDTMLKNVRTQLEQLNNVHFIDAEWQRFINEYLDKASDIIVDKTRKVQNDHIYDFVFDDGHIQNICLVDKKNLLNNKVQVIDRKSVV